MKNCKPGLFFDELDIFILRNVFLKYKDKEETDTWKMAKEFASNILKKPLESVYQTNEKDVNLLYKYINHRLKKYSKFNIIKISKNGGGKNVFELDLDSISFAKHKFSDGFKECLLIRL